MAADSIFLSYAHAQSDWVFERLLPALRGGGAQVIVDRERFAAGRAVVGQMDEWQDAAAKTLLVLTPEYLASACCQHEMRRAIARDPDFRDGRVIPLRRVACPLPPRSSPAGRCTST